MAGKCWTSLVLDETERVYWPSTGQSHDYKRHGTTTLFAALEVTTRKDHRGPFKTASPHRVSRLHEQRHRGFSGPLASRHPRQPQHPLEKRALAQGPPQRALSFHADKRVLARSGRGLVLDLQGQSRSGASFTSPKQLQEHIDAYINANNVKAKPSSGRRKRSVNADSKAAVSPSSDFRY